MKYTLFSLLKKARVFTHNSLSSCYLTITKIVSLNRWVIFVNSHTAQWWDFPFLSGGFSILNLVNSGDRNLVNSTSVHWDTDKIDVGFLEGYLIIFLDNKLHEYFYLFHSWSLFVFSYYYLFFPTFSDNFHVRPCYDLLDSFWYPQ